MGGEGVEKGGGEEDKGAGGIFEGDEERTHIESAPTDTDWLFDLLHPYKVWKTGGNDFSVWSDWYINILYTL